MTLFGLERKLTALNTDKIISEVMDNNKEVLGEINQSQLYAGKMKNGNHLYPTYYDDPFFTTKEQAIAYSNWKDKITPNSERPAGVPNLFINGFYYSSRNIKVQGNKIVFDADYKGDEIEAKYGEGINGLGGKYKAEFLNDFAGPEFRKVITSAIGLKFT